MDGAKKPLLVKSCTYKEFPRPSLPPSKGEGNKK